MPGRAGVTPTRSGRSANRNRSAGASLDSPQDTAEIRLMLQGAGGLGDETIQSVGHDVQVHRDGSPERPVSRRELLLVTRIRAMTAEDLPLGLSLSRQAGWNQTEEDWRRLFALQSDGCFVAELEGRIVATA